MTQMGNQAMDRTSEALDVVPKTYEEAVRVLAHAHAAGPDQVDIYYLPDSEQRTVRLIEVSETFPEGAVERPTPPNGAERIVPIFPMGPATDFPFRSEIIQVKPTEWVQLRKGNLKVNRDWGDLNLAQKVQHGD
jgi:hypothetical protein